MVIVQQIILQFSKLYLLYVWSKLSIIDCSKVWWSQYGLTKANCGVLPAIQTSKFSNVFKTRSLGYVPMWWKTTFTYSNVSVGRNKKYCESFENFRARMSTHPKHFFPCIITGMSEKRLYLNFNKSCLSNKILIVLFKNRLNHFMCIWK